MLLGLLLVLLVLIHLLLLELILLLKGVGVGLGVESGMSAWLSGSRLAERMVGGVVVTSEHGGCKGTRRQLVGKGLGLGLGRGRGEVQAVEDGRGKGSMLPNTARKTGNGKQGSRMATRAARGA